MIKIKINMLHFNSATIPVIYGWFIEKSIDLRLINMRSNTNNYSEEIARVFE